MPDTTATHDREYTYRDLVRAYLNARPYREETDPSGIDAQRYRHLAELFETDLTLRHPDFDREILRDFFEATAKRFPGAVSPFAGLLEAPGEICDLYRRYGGRMSELVGEMATSYFEILCQLYTAIFGDNGRVVTSEQLRRRGFEEPEVLDDDF